MDFITDFHTAHGFTTFWVVLDCFLKMAQFVRLCVLFSAPQLVQTFKVIFCLYGLRQFVSKF